MWARKQKKSEDVMVRIRNTESAIKHPDKKAMEWMHRKPYEGMKQNAKQEIIEGSEGKKENGKAEDDKRTIGELPELQGRHPGAAI